MKKTLLLCASALLMCAAASAQTFRAHRITLSESPAEYALPFTTVKVYITVDKEIIRSGPYARYSQKYLGTMAPLTDREVYSVRSARLDYTDPERSLETKSSDADGQTTLSHTDGGAEVLKTSPDRMSAYERSTEEMAREAANTIFTLRKKRLDLITGDAGENVFGAGLQAAIDEMSRMENELLSLFLGKRTVSTTTHEYDVVPSAAVRDNVVCHFSETGGLSAASGSSVLLTVVPENAVGQRGAKSGKNLYHVADFARCTLTLGSDTEPLAVARLPIYQFGVTVAGPASK